ncbi:CoA pyrophosphatase [Desulfobacterales bacterium HSG2]|nr:CoA pyrophosphatase [Desulfobacterales bacterium HSG2]
MHPLLNDPKSLTEHILQALSERSRREPYFSGDAQDSSAPSAVLLLLAPRCDGNGASSDPCLILNKRSQKVRQPGDICCPGGSVTPRLDACLAKLLTLPGFPLTRWPCWSRWSSRHRREATRLALLFAAGLREGFEEMGLNPLGVRFLGPLPPQHLRMFRRVIYPMAGWVPRQKRFVTNWEVEKVVRIPLRDLLIPGYYANYRLEFSHHFKEKLHRETEDFPCFRYQTRNEQEVLWGATYRIVTLFLELTFGFRPPDVASLPVIPGTLEGNYLTGGERVEK